MNESADVSEALEFRNKPVPLVGKGFYAWLSCLPKITLQQFNTQMILSRGARYVLILSNSEHILGIARKTRRLCTLLGKH